MEWADYGIAVPPIQFVSFESIIAVSFLYIYIKLHSDRSENLSS